MPSFRGSSQPRNGTSLVYVFLHRQAGSSDVASIPRLESSSGERKKNPLQYSCLGNLMDRGVRCVIPEGHKELDMTE